MKGLCWENAGTLQRQCEYSTGTVIGHCGDSARRVQGQCGDIAETLLLQCVVIAGLCNNSEGTVLVFSQNIMWTVLGQYRHNMGHCMAGRGQCWDCDGKIKGDCTNSAGTEKSQGQDSAGTVLG